METAVSRQRLTEKLMSYFTYSRCGDEHMPDGLFSHPACHMSLARIYGTDDTIDVHGGWHDAGDYGRYIVPAAKAVADLLLAYCFDPDLFENIKLLDEVRWELDWMMRMQRRDGSVYHKVTCAEFCGFISPEEETEELIVSPVSTEATADFCGACALASIVYRASDSAYADRLQQKAELAWDFLLQTERIPFYNPKGIGTGEYGAGENLSDTDERFFAACALYCASSRDDLKQWIQQNIPDEAINTSLGWIEMGGYGFLTLCLFADQQDDLRNIACSRLTQSGEDIERRSAQDPYGVPFTEYFWGSNMYLANHAVIVALASMISGNESCRLASKRMLGYLLGRNPLGMSYITGEDGFTGKSPLHPHHRPSMAAQKTMPGMLVGGPDSHLDDDYARQHLQGKPANECYVDAAESYSTNEVAIYWNSALILLLSLTDGDAIE